MTSPLATVRLSPPLIVWLRTRSSADSDNGRASDPPVTIVAVPPGIRWLPLLSGWTTASCGSAPALAPPSGVPGTVGTPGARRAARPARSGRRGRP